MGHTMMRSEPVARLDGHLTDLVDDRTGARHVHLATPDRNGHFCALYRTPPDDSTGAPHIMEHCVSGGSRRFAPGAGGDMYTRSLLTDVNGMTSADHTTYYFSTRNRTDYRNWMEYVIDVSLHPRMELDTFLRHRGHFELDGDGLRFVGTVFNEMKATFANPATHVFGALQRALFPGHPYANSSGGVPADMPSLRYEDILAFCRRFYHPANGIYLSYGDVPLDEILAHASEIIGTVGERRPPAMIPDVPRLDRPVVGEAPLPGGSGHVVIGWVTVDVTDAFERLAMEVASEAILEGPVRDALAASGLVRGEITVRTAPYARMLVAVSMDGVDPDDAARVEDVVLDTIASAEPDLGAAIARLELRRRDPATALGSFREAVIPAVVHGGDPFGALDLETNLARLRDEGIAKLVRTQLVDNPHRARVTLVPDASLEQRVRDAETAWLAGVEAHLSDADRTEIAEQTQRLRVQPPKDFPRRGLTPSEGLVELTEPVGDTHVIDGVEVDVYDVPSGGITTLTVRIDLTGLPDELAGHLGAFGTVHARVTPDGHRTLHWLELRDRALERDRDTLVRLLSSPGRFPDVARRASALEASVMPRAQVHLRRLAGSALRRSAALDDAVRGLGQLRFLKVAPPAAELPLFVRSRVAVCVAGDGAAALLGPVGDAIASMPAGDPVPSQAVDRLDGPRPHRARVAALPVAFTCEAHATGGLDDPDGPALAVLAQLAWSGFLNAEIRKGGAYGVDVEVLPERGLLWISSRRDPLPAATYRAFTEAWARFAEGRWDGPEASEGMLAALRVTDPVDHPASAARRAWLGRFTGHTAARWNAYRRAILEVTDDDLVRVAHRWLRDPARATLIGPAMRAADAFDETEDV